MSHKNIFSEPVSQPSNKMVGRQYRYFDAETLVYLRARYYDPSIGVFVSEDPLEGSIVEPMSLNRYSYVRGNPINITDPSGKQVNQNLRERQILEMYRMLE